MLESMGEPDRATTHKERMPPAAAVRTFPTVQGFPVYPKVLKERKKEAISCYTSEIPN
jgi:hypothetical protein